MRIVVKVGTSTLAHSGGRLNIRRTEQLVKALSDLKNSGCELVLVSSGAIGLGAGKLQIPRPRDMRTKQAAAAVGQCELMYVYDRLFAEYNHTVAQLLLTREDFEDTQRLENLENTVFRLLELGVIPIINENDTVATEEIAVGDNDTMSAMVAKYVHADLLILLSDIDGLYTKDPHRFDDAELISQVHKLTPEILSLAGDAGSALGTGGMATKLTAAGIIMDAGGDMVIANGKDPGVLYDIIEGKQIGTRFYGNGGK